MADTDTETQDGQAKKAKEPRGMDTVIMRELRRARKLTADGGAPTDEATFTVAMANVLALVDVAAAIREAAGVKAPS